MNDSSSISDNVIHGLIDNYKSFKDNTNKADYVYAIFNEFYSTHDQNCPYEKSSFYVIEIGPINGKVISYVIFLPYSILSVQKLFLFSNLSGDFVELYSVDRRDKYILSILNKSNGYMFKSVATDIEDEESLFQLAFDSFSEIHEDDLDEYDDIHDPNAYYQKVLKGNVELLNAGNHLDYEPFINLLDETEIDELSTLDDINSMVKLPITELSIMRFLRLHLPKDKMEMLLVLLIGLNEKIDRRVLKEEYAVLKEINAKLDRYDLYILSSNLEHYLALSGDIDCQAKIINEYNNYLFGPDKNRSLDKPRDYYFDEIQYYISLFCENDNVILSEQTLQVCILPEVRYTDIANKLIQMAYEANEYKYIGYVIEYYEGNSDVQQRICDEWIGKGYPEFYLQKINGLLIA